MNEPAPWVRTEPKLERKYSLTLNYPSGKGLTLNYLGKCYNYHEALDKFENPGKINFVVYELIGSGPVAHALWHRELWDATHTYHARGFMRASWKWSRTMKVTIELPEMVEINSGETTVQFSWEEVAKDKLLAFIAEAACVGVAKAGNDSASGAKAHAEKNGLDVESARRELIESWVEARYQSGEFGRSGVGESAETREAKSMLRVVVKQGDAKKYKNASPEERDAMVDAAWSKLGDVERESYMKAAAARLALKAEQAKALAALAPNVKL